MPPMYTPKLLGDAISEQSLLLPRYLFYIIYFPRITATYSIIPLLYLQHKNGNDNPWYAITEGEGVLLLSKRNFESFAYIFLAYILSICHYNPVSDIVYTITRIGVTRKLLIISTRIRYW